MLLVSSPDPWLQKVVQPFDFDNLDAKLVSGQMARLMLAKNGIGLSANQVGLDAQIFVQRPLEHKEITKPFAVINPKILELDDKTELGKEGCLSHIGLVLNIRRSKRLVAQFLDIEGKECIIEFKGIDARCFLHEFDHLNGIEFVDRVSKLKLEMAKKKQKKLMQEFKNNG